MILPIVTSQIKSIHSSLLLALLLTLFYGRSSVADYSEDQIPSKCHVLLQLNNYDAEYDADKIMNEIDRIDQLISRTNLLGPEDKKLLPQYETYRLNLKKYLYDSFQIKQYNAALKEKPLPGLFVIKDSITSSAPKGFTVSAIQPAYVHVGESGTLSYNLRGELVGVEVLRKGFIWISKGP